MGTLDDRIALVTGAARGIGRAVATKLAAAGATVVVTDIDRNGAEQVAASLGHDSIAVPLDVTDRASVDAAVERTTDTFGHIDILVNNAGWDKGEPFVESEPETWDKLISINLYGVLHMCHAVLPVMIEQGHGHVVNLGSDAGRVGSTGESVYSAAKGGVIAFTKTIARESARYGINCNCVSPGPTDTDLFASMGGPKLREALTKAIPMKRLAQPEDLANTVVFFASDEASYLTGQTVSVSGGLTMA